eukprot:5293226-Prymnesium_polylepis.1
MGGTCAQAEVGLRVALYCAPRSPASGVVHPPAQGRSVFPSAVTAAAGWAVQASARVGGVHPLGSDV